MYTLIWGYLVYMVNPLSFFVCLFQLVGLQYYTIYFTSQSIPAKICAHANFLYRVIHVQGKSHHTGFFFSRKACGYVFNTPMDNSIVYMVSTDRFYDMIMAEDLNRTTDICVPVQQKKTVSVLMRRGCYKSLFYSQYQLDVAHLEPKETQSEIVDAMSDFFCKNNKGVVWLSGVTGSGKTTVGYLLAKKLNCTFCRTFNPSEPGDELSNLVSENNPLILVIEEADVMIENIHHQRIRKHDDLPIAVYNKPSWNTFLDDIAFYPILLILTSNVPLQAINKLDTSYLRPGRVNLTFTLTEKIVF